MSQPSGLETTTTSSAERATIDAQADLHHQYFMGLQLAVAVRHGPGVIGDWMFRLFRRQHEAKFLSSFGKLGLDGLPHAVACARYHVLSNGIGGVPVEYMEESDHKAWVRFRYPRWMYEGPVVCGVPIEASRGFLGGWYAQNGVSLGNPRLGFVCVSEDMSGQFGLCGYFREYDHDLGDGERLRFAPDERPPPFDPAAQPVPPDREWSEERLAKARRNYACEYIRNGLVTLAEVLGRDAVIDLARHTARLTGLQRYRTLAAMVGARDGGPEDAAGFLTAMLGGMGDDVRCEATGSDTFAIHQNGVRIVRGIEGADRAMILDCWTELWVGTIRSHRAFMDLSATVRDDGIDWHLTRAG